MKIADLSTKRPNQERAGGEESLEELVEELIAGDFKSNSGQALICALALCNRIMRFIGVARDCKWDNTQMNNSLPLDSAAVEFNDDTGSDTLETIVLPYDAPIFLVGMMGAGKTTIGRGLARLLSREFVDLDHELEARCGVRVSLIFDIEGEQGFRKRETSLLDECSRRPGIVLATGGGAILAPENRRYLKERGVVVYLRANGDELYRRVARDRSRPLLQTPNPRARVAELLQVREPLYTEVASLVFETGTMPVSHVVRSLIPLLQNHEISL